VCQRDVLARVMFRFKVPIRLTVHNSLYVVFLFGYSDYMSRAKDRPHIDFHGVTPGAAFGFENYKLDRLSPFIEVRYMFHAGIYGKTLHDADYPPSTKQTLYQHSLSVNVGFRIP